VKIAFSTGSPDDPTVKTVVGIQVEKKLDHPCKSCWYNNSLFYTVHKLRNYSTYMVGVSAIVHAYSPVSFHVPRVILILHALPCDS
jgi:hypothetical protein